MTRLNDQYSKVRHVVEATLKPGKRRKALLDDPLMEMPLQQAVLQKDLVITRMSMVPHIGSKTALTIYEALNEQASLRCGARNEEAAVDQAD